MSSISQILELKECTTTLAFCFFYWDVFLPLHGKNTLYTDPHCAHKLGLFPKGLTVSSSWNTQQQYTPFSQPHYKGSILNSPKPGAKTQQLKSGADQPIATLHCPPQQTWCLPPAALQDTFPQHCLPATFPTLTLNSLVFLVTFFGGKAGLELCLKSTTSYPNSIHQETSPTPIRMESSFHMSIFPSGTK